MPLNPNRQRIEIAYSETPAEVPTGLEKGEFGVNLADTPPRLYVGGPSGPLVLAGGAQYVQLSGDTMTGPLVVSNSTVTVNGSGGRYNFVDQTIPADQWQLRATGGRAAVSDPAGVDRLYIGKGTGAPNTAVLYHHPAGILIVSKNAAVGQPMLANLNLIGQDYQSGRLVVDSFGSNEGSQIWLRSAGGTAAAMTPSSGYLGGIYFVGCMEPGQFSGGAAAQIVARPVSSWTGTNTPAALEFVTTPSGGGSAILVMRLHYGLALAQGAGGAYLEDMGIGTINAAGVFVNGVQLGFTPSVAWTADTDPDNITIFINSTGRDLIVSRISFVAEVANGDAAEVIVVHAASGTPLSLGTPVAVPFDANPVSPGMVTTVTPVGTTLPAGSRLGLQTAGNWLGNSVASITVYLEPS